MFVIFPAHANKKKQVAPNGARRIFPTIPDLADILGDTHFDFENFYFSNFVGSQISGLGPAWAPPRVDFWGHFLMFLVFVGFWGNPEIGTAITK